MPIYITRPKASAIKHSFNLTAKKFISERRQPQLEEVTTLYQENATYQTIQTWVEETQNEGNLKIIKDPSQPGVTGTVVTQMSAEVAEQMAQEVPNALILQDSPIELIQPQCDKNTAKEQLNDDDLWHLEAIGLISNRANGFAYTGQGVTIAVLDTGIDPTHPELNGKVVGAYRFIGENWQVHEEEISRDVHGHGTHVAGLICGKRVGIAPNSRLINGLTLSQPKGVGTLANLILAIDWVAISRSD